MKINTPTSIAVFLRFFICIYFILFISNHSYLLCSKKLFLRKNQNYL